MISLTLFNVVLMLENNQNLQQNNNLEIPQIINLKTFLSLTVIKRL